MLNDANGGYETPTDYLLYRSAGASSQLTYDYLDLFSRYWVNGGDEEIGITD